MAPYQSHKFRIESIKAAQGEGMVGGGIGGIIMLSRSLAFHRLDAVILGDSYQ